MLRTPTLRAARGKRRGHYPQSYPGLIPHVAVDLSVSRSMQSRHCWLRGDDPPQVPGKGGGFPALRAGATLPQRGTVGCGDPQARLLFRQTGLRASLNPLGDSPLRPPLAQKSPASVRGFFVLLQPLGQHEVVRGIYWLECRRFRKRTRPLEPVLTFDLPR